MQAQLVDLREAVVAYACSLDEDILSSAQARMVLTEAATIGKVAADLQARAASRLASLGPKGSGKRLAARELARRSGTGVRRAEEAIDTQRRLRSLPATSSASRRGELSPAQSQAVAVAAEADPEAESHLLGVAMTRSLAELNDEASRVRAAATDDAEERRRRILGQRHLRSWSDVEGRFHFSFLHTPEAGAKLLSALGPFTDAAVQAARADGRSEPIEAHAADALVAMAESTADNVEIDESGNEVVPAGPAPGGQHNRAAFPRRQGAPLPGAARSDGVARAGSKAGLPPAHAGRRGLPAKIIVRVDLGALLRGQVRSGEVCEIAGVGPVAVSAIRDLMATNDPFLAAVVTDGKRLTGAVHLGRRPNALQQSVLEWLYPDCAVEGCSSQSCLEYDHRVDWSKTRETVVDLMDRLCRAHHGLKTTKGWALVEGTGKRAFVAPDDPRHPRHVAPGRTPRRIDTG